MDKLELFRILSGRESDPRDSEAIWASFRDAPGFIDSRDCGLVDAVQSGWFLNETNELFKGFSIDPEDCVLDIGCGNGGATLFCAKRGAHVIFLDAVAEKVEALQSRVRQTPARKVEGLVNASLPLPLPDAIATRVICTEVLEHVDDPAAFVDELKRVAHPGALLLLSVPDAVGETMQRAIAPASYFAPPNHIHVFGRDQFHTLVTEAGLEVISHGFYGFFWTIWMCLYWTLAKQKGLDPSGESFDVVQPPHPPLLNDWAKIWHQLICMPESAPLKQALDQLLPKSQVIVARKPAIP